MIIEPEIAPIAERHVEGFRRALDVVARERKYLALLEAPPIADTRDFVLKGLARRDLRFVVLAEGEVVGWCDVERHFFPSESHRGLLGMGLLPAWRGKGLGRRLIAHALNEAWASGFTRVELSVYVDNAPALALYRRLGFTQEGVVRDAVRIDGQYRDAIAMAILRR